MTKKDMITQAKNRFAYYWQGYPYDDASDVTPGGGGDEDYVTKEEMNAALEDTVKSIAIKNSLTILSSGACPGKD